MYTTPSFTTPSFTHPMSMPRGPVKNIQQPMKQMQAPPPHQQPHQQPHYPPAPHPQQRMPSMPTNMADLAKMMDTLRDKFYRSEWKNTNDPNVTGHPVPQHPVQHPPAPPCCSPNMQAPHSNMSSPMAYPYPPSPYPPSPNAYCSPCVTYGCTCGCTCGSTSMGYNYNYGSYPPSAPLPPPVPHSHSEPGSGNHDDDYLMMSMVIDTYRIYNAGVAFYYNFHVKDIVPTVGGDAYIRYERTPNWRKKQIADESGEKGPTLFFVCETYAATKDCPHGAYCRGIHANVSDLNAVPTTLVHSKLHGRQSGTLPAGRRVTICDRATNTTTPYDSEDVLRTKGSLDWLSLQESSGSTRRKIYHCKHFKEEGLCLRGPDCVFLHVMDGNPMTTVEFRPNTSTELPPMYSPDVPVPRAPTPNEYPPHTPEGLAQPPFQHSPVQHSPLSSSTHLEPPTRRASTRLPPPPQLFKRASGLSTATSGASSPSNPGTPTNSAGSPTPTLRSVRRNDPYAAYAPPAQTTTTTPAPAAKSTIVSKIRDVVMRM